MEKKYLENLNDNQLEAIKYFDTPLAIIAAAGSGKTRVITNKIIYLIEEKNIQPKRILAVTFTNKAVKEMKERVVKITNSEKTSVNICTYHSLCLQILREDIDKLGYPNRFNILDEIDQKQILVDIYKKLDISYKSQSYASAISYISKNKNIKNNPNELIDAALDDNEKFLALTYKKYLEEIHDIKALDFDDLLIFTYDLFQSFPSVVQKWSNRFDYILIDEFQDTSFIQYSIIKSLVRDGKITIVGDPDQTIYTWRNADVSLINNFKNYFEDAKIIKLEQNYRSFKKILDAANNLIAHNNSSTIFEKKLIATTHELGEVNFYHGFSDEDEARWIANQILILKSSGVNLRDIAILYRSNYLSANIEKALIMQNINYSIWGGVRFYQREEIKDAISYLKIINNNDEIALKRMINVPSRKLGGIALDHIFSLQQKKSKTLWETLVSHFNEIDILPNSKKNLASFIDLINKYKIALKSNKIHTILEKFLIEVEYYGILNPTEDISRIENLKELIKIIKVWEEKNNDLNLNDFLEETSLFSDKDDNNLIDFVTLMTVHTSKGLEFENVFIAGFSEDIFPSSRSQNEKGLSGLEEERRLAYVAITRAKKKLFISDSKGFSQDYKTQKRPSRFINEMGIDIKNFVKYFIAPKNIEENYDKKRNQDIIVGDEIKHDIFGIGIVVSLQGELIEIAFKDPYGVKTMMKSHKTIQKVG